MNSIKRYFIWLRRMSHSRGLGVQSPSAYRFIRYVISEHYPYYAYDDLRKKYPALDWLTRKRMELYFRLSNFCRTNQMIDYSEESSLLADYVKHGCCATRVLNVYNEVLDALNARLMRICPIDGCDDFLEIALAESDQESVFVVEDICTRAFAMCACDIFLDFEFLGCTCGDFFQCERHFDTKVCSAILRFLTLTATEAATKSSKSAVSSEYVAEHREDVVHGESASAESSASESSARSVKSELVVLLPFL